MTLEAFRIADAEALTDALTRLAVEDALAVPYLGEAACAELVACCEMLTYRAGRPVVGPPERAVYQDLELTTDIPADSRLRAYASHLEADLQGALERQEPPLLGYPFVINDFIVQRYSPGQKGITPHRDHVRYRGLVAILVLSGAGRFSVCTDREGSGRRDIPAPPGSLLLMRAPDFAGLTDRPFHVLSDITVTRYSFGLRYDTQT